MDFLGAGIPIGRYLGINVRLHFSLIIFALWRVQGSPNIVLALAVVAGLFLCVLLHEFGHALAARWCDGEAEDILLWPLGGLAFVRPAFHPTAYLITTVAGPFVTLVLWLLFWAITVVLLPVAQETNSPPLVYVWAFCENMRFLNLMLLVFNLIPAFPMDGGRIVRDSLWFKMSCEKATYFAVVVSRVIAGTAVLAWFVSNFAPDVANAVIHAVGTPAAYVFLYTKHWWTLLMAGFILMQTLGSQQHVGFGATAYGFSIRERLKRGKRQRSFRQAVELRGREDAASAFHRCAACGLTDKEAPQMSFRVCTDCSNYEEYCAQHINNHKHT